MRKLIFVWLLSAYCIAGMAQIPAGYYNPAQGLVGTPLRLALHNIIDGHTVVQYGDLYDAFESTDKKSNGKVWDMYSDIPGGTPPYEYSFTSGDQCGSYSGEGDCYNREHSFPASWFNDAAPTYSDLFHLYPTDGYVNNRRSNYPFGEVGSASWTSENGSKVGNSNYPGWTGVTVFEPIDEYKGDFARSYFYISTRYYTEDSGWPANYNTMVNKCEIKPKPMEMLLQWHHDDPVSTKEINRNNAIYGIQHNRNPFIDHPEYADAIWDPDYIGVPVNSVIRTHIYPNPVTESFTIETPEGVEQLSIKVIDCTGKIIFETISNNQETNISCGSWPEACYFVQLQTENEISVQKLIRY